MTYRVSWKESGRQRRNLPCYGEEPEKLECMTRAEVVEWVKDHLDDLDKFAERGGNVYCYVSELDYHMKPTALQGEMQVRTPERKYFHERKQNQSD